jgi:hypothetical protein
MEKEKRPAGQKLKSLVAAALVVAATMAVTSLGLAGCPNTETPDEDSIVYTGWAYGKLSNWEDYTDWTVISDVPATREQAGQKIQEGTEHKVNIRENGAVEKLSGEGNTRTYSAGNPHLRKEDTIPQLELILPKKNEIPNLGLDFKLLDAMKSHTGGNTVIANLAGNSAANTAESGMISLSKQAGALAQFFDGIKNATQAEDAKFTALKAAETSIKGHKRHVIFTIPG